MHPDRDLFPFHPRPIPMRKEVQNLLGCPPGLVIEECVLRESAHVDDSVLRTDVGPSVRRGFAAIVEPRPHKASQQPRPRIAEAPPAFSRSASRRGVRVIRTHIAFAGVGNVDAARANGAHGFRSHHRPAGMRVVKSLGAGVHVVVAHHVAYHQAAGSNRPGRSDRHQPRTILLGCDVLHRGQDTHSPIPVRLAFFISHRPHKDAGMIAVAPHQILELAQAFRI